MMLIERYTGRIGKFGKLTKQDTPSALATPDFTSSEQTVAINTRLEVAHSLGTVPTLVQVVMRCTTANLNYSVGDEIFWGGFANTTIDDGIIIFGNSTNIVIVQGDAITILNHNTPFSQGTITTTSWRWVARAWK